MTDDLAPQELLADVSRQRVRTRRLVESDWFTFAVLGVALTLGGLVPDRWGWVFAAAMVAAYLAIVLRWRYVVRTFSWQAGSAAVEWLPLFLGAAIGIGDWAWGTQLHGDTATVAVSLWTAAGMLGFWRLTRSPHCLALALSSLGVGAFELIVTGFNETLGYGVAFGVWALAHWVRLGRRTA